MSKEFNIAYDLTINDDIMHEALAIHMFMLTGEYSQHERECEENQFILEWAYEHYPNEMPK